MRLALCFLVFVTAGCFESHLAEPRMGPGADGSVVVDAGEVLPDGAPRLDGSRPDDGGWLDGGRFDGGRFDGGRFDGGSPTDGGRPDTGVLDAGAVSRALSFPTGTRRLVVAHASSLDLIRDQTLELWVRARSPGTVSVKGSERSRNHFRIAVADGRVRAGWTADDAVREVTGPLRDGVWTHVALVLTVRPAGIEARLVLDGTTVDVELFDDDLRQSLNDSPWVFGGFAGDIDEVRLWTVARSEGAIHGAMRTRFRVARPAMEVYLPLEERGQIAFDRTLRGHDAVLGLLVEPDPADPVWIDDGPI